MNVRTMHGWRVAFFVVVLHLTCLLLLEVDRPWTGHRDFNGAVWSIAARVHVRSGLAETRGVPAYFLGIPPIPAEAFYIHHPFLFPLMVSGSFAVFGEHEWAARAVPIVCSLATLMLLWTLVKRMIGERAATLTALVFACMPMEGFFGRMVNPEPCALMWMLAGLLCLDLWRSSRRAGWVAAAVLVFVLAMATSWHAYLLTGLVATFMLFGHDRAARNVGLLLLGVCAASAGAFLLHARVARADAWQDMFHAFLFRLGSSARVPFTFSEWFIKVSDDIRQRISLPILVLAVGGIIVMARCGVSTRGLASLRRFTSVFALMATMYIAIWRNASYIHDYAGFFLIIPVATLGGLALDAMCDWKPPRFRASGVVVVSLLAVGLLVGSWAGTARLHAFQKRFLAPERAQPSRLIPELGRRVADAFPPGTQVLCNFEWQGPELDYYADRPVLYGQAGIVQWRALLPHPVRRFRVMRRGSWARWEIVEAPGRPVGIGGLIWMGHDGSADLLSELPPGSRECFEVGDFRFCLWKPLG